MENIEDVKVVCRLCNLEGIKCKDAFSFKRINLCNKCVAKENYRMLKEKIASSKKKPKYIKKKEPIELYKKCCKCFELKTLSSFSINRASKNGYSGQCKNCNNDYKKQLKMNLKAKNTDILNHENNNSIESQINI